LFYPSSNSSKLLPPYDVSSEIILVSEAEFYKYLEDNNKVTLDQLSPRFYQYAEPPVKNHNYICV